MAYSLQEINARVRRDPAGFVAECEDAYRRRIAAAADKICGHRQESPIVLLSGPSSSGKTTTAQKLERELERRGIEAHTVSMDDYYMTLDRETCPRTPEGEVDLESPELLDMDLMNEHFTLLSRGEEIQIPHFDFPTQTRSSDISTPMRLGKDEIAIFEGIHAFNQQITTVHPEAFKLFISADSRVESDGRPLILRRWSRLIRRMVRDSKFRGTEPGETLKMWENVVQGERLYILPRKDEADLRLDSTYAYEQAVLRDLALPMMNRVGDERVLPIIQALAQFEPMSEDLVPADSMLREFIGKK